MQENIGNKTTRIYGGIAMGKRLNSKKFNTIYIIVVTFLYVTGFALLFSSKGISVQGTDGRHGVYFVYGGKEYKVFMIPPMDRMINSSDFAMWIPDDTEYNIVKDKNFCEKYALWNGHCSCYKKFDKLDGQLNLTMNWTGKPKQYVFHIFQYENRKITEVVHISDGKGACGYGYATDKLTKVK